MNQINIIDVNSANIDEAGIYCIKNNSSPGSKAKISWCRLSDNRNLKIKIALDSDKKQLGFIEYTPAESAWRPIEAKGYLFIHCIGIFGRDARGKNIGLSLIKECEKDARSLNKSGVCVMTSKGPWIADKRIFEKDGYKKVDELDRFELMVKKFNTQSPVPRLINWREKQKQYQGWNLIYSDQCPWHDKSVSDLKEAAKDFGINLKLSKITTSSDAKKAPSGFAVFSLIRDGRLLEDHYLSKTRFNNILKSELKNRRK